MSPYHDVICRRGLKTFVEGITVPDDAKDRSGQPEGRALPIKESNSLRAVGAPGPVILCREGKSVANASGDEAYNFQGLERGLYTIEANGRAQEVVVNGDQTLDLAGKGAAAGDWRKILGVILIIGINLAGILAIIRILRKG